MKHESDELRIEPFTLHVDRWRGGDAGHVLLLHGLGGNSITWHGVAPYLAQALRAHVVAVDYPGFGASRPGSAALSTRVLARVTHAVMSAEAPRARWVLGGNSLGGLLALETACRFPEQVAAVHLAALSLPLAWGRPSRGLRDMMQYVAVATPWQGRRLVTRYVTTRGVPGVVDDPVKLLFADPTRLDTELRQRLIEVSEYRLTWAADAARAYEQVTRSLGLQLIWPELGARWIQRVICPVLSIHGTRDPLYPPSAWQHLQQLRPDWSHVSLHDIGHVPQLEAPREFAEQVASWLRAHWPPRG